jgi:nucleoid-associated protein YgaU
MKIVTLLTLILTLCSCSFSDSNKEEVAVTHDDLEFAVDTIADQPENQEFKVEEEKVAETVIPDEYQAPPVQEEVAMSPPQEPSFEEFKQPEAKVEEFLTETPVPAVEKTKEAPARIKIKEERVMASTTSYGPMETYRVQKGDTMMMIAFKIYGDYRKWKDINEWNKDVKKIGEGVELKYMVPDQRFGWQPSGLPYLIKTADTLGTISKEKYGTRRKWKSIYENNRPLIRNPNLIFAGFTIYYQPARSLASEPK